MNLVHAAALCLALLAASPLDLVAGSVRDQHGTPIAGAHVRILQAGREIGRAVTAADGTFVFSGSGSSVEIACRFCRAAHVDVDAQGIATVVVTRYDALANEGPSSDDLTHLPVASPAQLLTLEPFVVVNETSRTVPGLSATDRNATPYGGLAIVDGAPDYDVNAAITPFDTIPQGGVAQLDVLRVDQAYRYGDTAQGGTFAFTSTGGDSHAGAGGASVLRGVGSAGNLAAAASYSNAAIGARAQRAAADVDMSTRSLTGDVQVSSGSGYDALPGASALFSSFSSAIAEVQTRGPIDAFTRFTADRGTYAYTSVRAPESATWSDVDLEAGVTSHAVLAPFALLQVRQSSNDYYSAATGNAELAGSISQARATGGLAYSTDAVHAFAAIGTDAVGYAGLPGALRQDAETASDAVISATWDVSQAWSLHASTSSGYTLAPFLAAYQSSAPPGLYQPPVTTGHTNEALLEYTDGSRLRVGATALAWSGSAGAATSSAGFSAAWQIAPKISLRTWFLSESSTSWASGTVGSAWATYENGDAFRVDVYAGRSLLDRSPHASVNASVSGRLTAGLDWFVSSSSFFGAQAGTAGLRIH